MAGDENFGRAVRRTLFVPPIPDSTAHIDDIRTSIVQNLKRLAQSGYSLSDPVKEVSRPHFHLAYQGRNDRLLQSAIAEFFLQVCPSLGWVAPHCQTISARKHSRRLRLGLCSNNFRNNTVGLFFLGFVQGIDRSQFDVTLFRAPAGGSDVVTQRYEAAVDRTLVLSPQLDVARQQIAQAQLDILFYPDLTVHALPTYLAYARLAPVQVTSWGHPVTSGIPNIDYFLSATVIEPDNADEHYTEDVVRLSHFPTWYQPGRLVQSPLTRADFNLPEEKTLYMSGQQAFKFHPDFDPILGEILHRDPEGLLLIISAWEPAEHCDLLRTRLIKANPEVADRIIVRKRLSILQYMALAALADVHLDPIYFGGGRTTFDLLANGKVVVTWPGPYQRGRVTTACLRMMGIAECIVERVTDYAERAVQLGRDTNRRQRLEHQIRERAAVLLPPTSLVGEIEDFFVTALEQQRHGGSPR